MTKLPLAALAGLLLSAGPPDAGRSRVEFFQSPDGKVHPTLELPDGGVVELRGKPPGPYFFLDGGRVPKHLL